MIHLEQISMVYGKGESRVKALQDITLSVEHGEFLAVTGKSGCGKSTLLNVIGGIVKPTKGVYRFGEKEITGHSVNQLAEFRNRSIGFVLQHFALIQEYTVFQNIALPLRFRKERQKQMDTKIMSLLKRLELADKRDAYPPQLSGGQSQRAAIARAIIGNPELLLLDEPTGALDERTGRQIMNIFHELNKQGMTIVMVTHDRELAASCTKHIVMRDGKIVDMPR